MPRIFDNIEQRLRPALAETMGVAHRADFCVGVLAEVDRHASVFVAHVQSKKSGRGLKLHTSRYQRWYGRATSGGTGPARGMRDGLFQGIRYSSARDQSRGRDAFGKYDGDLGRRTLAQIRAVADCKVSLLRTSRETRVFVFYQEATQYWAKVTYGLPYFEKNGVVGPPAHGRCIYFHDRRTAHVVCAILNSSVFYNYFLAYGDCFHLSDRLVGDFPIMKSMNEDMALVRLNKRLMQSLRAAAENKTIRTRDGDTITYAE